MNSTREGDVPPYLGIDLTDRYAPGCRDIDVCGLIPTENGELTASFWFWQWDPEGVPLEVTAIVEELKASKAMLDGPQGLAAPGNALRKCERLCAAAGKTPDVRPRGRPFDGFICSSLDLFAALKQAGVPISSPRSLGGVCEVYPGYIWRILAGRVLPKKSSREGRLARKRILEALRVSGLRDLPTHDQNDACVAAILAAAADGKVPSVSRLTTIGSPLTFDDDGILREGPMIIPDVVSTTIHESISKMLLGTPVVDAVPSSEKRALPSADPDGLAEDLLTCFIDKALKGNPIVCTYSWAYRYLFHASYARWAQEYARRVIEVAERTCLRELRGLGDVRLDAFVVSRSSKLPSGGHWQSAHYEREDWERILGRATVLD